MVTVEKMPQTITYEGQTYGPSQTPVQVPEELAAALNLRVLTANLSASVAGHIQDDELAAAQHLAGQYQGKLEGLLEQLAPFTGPNETPEDGLTRLTTFVKQSESIFLPVAGDGGREESGLEAMQRIVNERGSLQREVKRLQDIVDVGKPENERLMRERADLQGRVRDLQGELTATRTTVADLKAERDTLVTASAEYREYVGDLLPHDYPDRKLWMENGYITTRHIAEATDAELIALPDIGKKKVEAARKITPHKAADTGEQ